MNKKTLNIIAVFLVSAIIIAFISYLNFLTPLFADDFSYSVSFVTKAPVTSFFGIIKSQYLHYFTTNGRSVVHTLAQLLLAIGKPKLNIINGLAFFTMIVLICYHATGELRKIKPWQIIFVFAALWFFTPHFGGSYLWIMGSANYMYSPQIILLFLIPYGKFLRNNKVVKKGKRASVLCSVLMFLFGIIAGWTNENTTIALIFMVASINIFALVSKKKPYLWMWCGLVGNAVGAALLFFSPAQAKRLDAAGGFGSFSVWLERFDSISKKALGYFAILLALIVISLVFSLIKYKKRAFPEVSCALIFLIGTAISLYSMVASPEFPATVWSSILAFFMIPTLFFVDNTKIFENRVTALVSALALFAAVSINFSFVAPELVRINYEYEVREELIKEAEAGGYALEVDLIVTESTYSPYSLFHELGRDASAWPNNAVANFYGINSIKTKK